MKKRILALLLTLVMIVGMLPTFALAEDAANKAGDNITWSYDAATKTLTFTGLGEMYPYDENTPAWAEAELDVETLTVGEGITTIGAMAFYLTDFAGTLKEVTLPSTLTKIGYSAFQDTTSVNEIVIPASVTEIGADAFGEWTAAQKIHFEAREGSLNLGTACGDATVDYDYKASTEPTEPDDGIVREGKLGEDITWKLTENDTLLTLTGTGATYDYSEADLAWYHAKKDDRVYTKVKKIVVGEGITEIGPCALGCGADFENSVKEIKLPSTLTKIDDNAFDGLRVVTSLTLPKNLKTIGEQAFGNLSVLPSLTLPEGLETIGDSAFIGLHKVTKVTIPASVKYVGKMAFIGLGKSDAAEICVMQSESAVESLNWGDFWDGKMVGGTGNNITVTYKQAGTEEPTTPTLVEGVYQLTSKDDLKWFRDQVNNGNGTINAKLTKDIDLGSEAWTPIGVAADYVTSYENKPFSGVFDGNEKTISGLNVTETAGNPAALFGMVKNATIRKLVVKGTVSSTAPSDGYMPVYAGGVVGQSDGGVTLEEVASYVDVTLTNNTSNTDAIGGLAGNGYGMTIKNCANYGKLTATGTGEVHIGGLCGMSPWGGTATIETSVNAGELADGKTVGGLISSANSGTTVKKSVALGEPAGALGGTFESCLTTANTVKAEGVEVVTDMKDEKVLETLGTAFKKAKNGLPLLSWMTDDTTEPEQPGDDTIEIATEEDLKAFRDKVNGGEPGLSAKLTADIELEDAWTPIAKSEKTPYTGKFDGQGHTISGLNISSDGTGVSTREHFGLFGAVQGAEICNLKLSGEMNLTVTTGGVQPGVGGVVGMVVGTEKATVITGVTSKVNITAKLSSVGTYVGGLVGSARKAKVTISECANVGNVSASGYGIAGLIGYLDDDSTVECSYNAGSVTATGETDEVGGLVAKQDGGSVTDCYNMGTVTNEQNFYGAAGLISLANGEIKRCYNGGTITAKATDDGSRAFPGVKASSTTKDTEFYSVGEAAAEFQKTTGQVVTADTLRGMAETLGAAFKENKGSFNSGYPLLAWQCSHENINETVTDNNDGTHTVTKVCADCGETLSAETQKCTKDADNKCPVCGHVFPAGEPGDPVDGYYEIKTEANLKWFRDEVNGGRTGLKAKLMNDIKLTEAWTPIGTSENNFAGVFDGNGKTISDLHFDVKNTPEESQSLGLFGFVGGSKDSTAEIRDLTVSGEINVSGKQALSFTVGGVAAYADRYTTISGVTSNVTVVNQPADSVTTVITGGLIGATKGGIFSAEIKNCANLGNVTGSDKTGGLIGSAGDGMTESATLQISGCYNAGAVSGGGETGGLTGEAGRYVKIDDCYNVGTVAGGEDYTGGLVGVLHARLRTSYNAGTVTGAEGKTGTAVGRLVGSGSVGTIDTTFVTEEPGIGNNGSGQEATLVTDEQLRKIPEGLNENDSFKVNPGKTPALKWQEIDACAHKTYTTTYVPGKDADGFYHKSAKLCSDCFETFDEQTREACTPDETTKKCTACGQLCCEHTNTTVSYTTRDDFVREDGKFVLHYWHTPKTTCTDCGSEFVGDETDCTESAERYTIVSDQEGKHRHEWVCVCGTAIRSAMEPCVDEKINATGAEGEDNLCDLCGATMVLSAPQIDMGKCSGFDSYEVELTSGKITRYHVMHYEVNETADELTAAALGSKLNYQWYYRLTENGTEEGTKVAGATNATYTPDTRAETGMRFYYCKVWNDAGSATTDGQPVIVGPAPTATVYFSLTNDDKYVVANGDSGSGKVMAYQKVTVPYFDLKEYGMEDYYFQSETYSAANPDDPMGGSALAAGSSASAYGRITALHLLIWMIEREYYSLDENEAGKGYLYDQKVLDTDVFTIASSSSVGSIKIDHYWNHDMNFNYYLNYVYPLAAGGWGSTADQILMRDGDIFSLAMFSDWSYYNDALAGFHHLGSELNRTMIETQVKADDSVDLTLYRSYGHDKSKYTTAHVPVGNLDVYYVETSKLTSGDVTTWRKAGTVDENGKFTLDAKALELEAGKTYLFSVAGQKGKTVNDFVSCPGGVLVNVLAADAVQNWTVRFKNGKEDYATKKVENGKLVTVENPAREGYAFTGWYTDESCTNRFDIKTTPVTCDLMLYAGWKEGGETTTWTVTYVIAFVGSKTETVENGQKLVRPEDPKHDGYTFVGWYTDKACQNKYDFDTPVTSDLTLYALWDKDEVTTWTVTFVNRGETYDEQNVEDGETADKPENPTRKGYKFLGWYTEKACRNKYDFDDPVTEDLTLYAGWREKSSSSGSSSSGSITSPNKPSTKPDTSTKQIFKDVANDAWYADSVRYVYEKGIMNGTGANRFSPDASTTRGMIVTILARLEGVNTTGTPWYAKGREWAMDAGVSDGTNMEGEITREQLAAMLYRYAKLKGYDVSASADISGYTDASRVSGWALDAMRWAVAEGLIQGMGGKLNPQATATRAQVATILMRFLELYSK